MSTDPRHVVLITGTSSGIGLATAVSAARAGWTVVATMRDPSRAGRLRAAAADVGVEVDVRALDVTDADSARVCLTGVMADHGRLDALVNNAGSAHVGTVETDPMGAIRESMEVNFFGVVALTQLAMPLLRTTGGRVVTVTSVGGVVGQPFNEAYCAAKFAVEGFMEALAPVAATVGVGVAVVEPAAVASEFIGSLGLDVEALVSAAGPYAAPMAAYLDRTGVAFAAAQPAAEVGDVIAGVLSADPLPFRSQTSDGATRFVGLKLADLDGAAVQRLTASWLM
ncbi:MAG: SDR family NAD(P)-dependent oxidoreductase [Nakamurella sp.]